MNFKEVISWFADDKPETTKAIVLVSECGTVVKRLPYKKWNDKNQSYSNMKEHTYPQSTNRGKQRLEIKHPYRKYKHVTIKNKALSVHRLVAMAFIPNPESKPQVNHIDGMRDNNHISNLEWVTNQENRTHAKENMPRLYHSGEENNSSKLTDDAVKEIKEKFKAPYVGLQVELAKKFGVVPSTIRWVVLGATWRGEK